VLPLKDNIPTDRFPVITVALIVINVLMYFLFQEGRIGGVNELNVVLYGAIPYEITHPGEYCRVIVDQLECGPGRGGQPHTVTTIFTSMFMHGGLLHLAGNMLFLWIFGNNVEDSMGRLKFVGFYLLGGLAAVLGQVLVGSSAQVPLIGASGAVAAVIGGYILLYPHARVLTVVFIIFFFTVIELPAVLMIGIWFLEQILFGSLQLTNPRGGGGGVAYFAHIGGFAFGLLLIKAFATRHKQVPPRVPVY
jgi:membrane associated rhomboid family serine protease